MIAEGQISSPYLMSNRAGFKPSLNLLDDGAIVVKEIPSEMPTIE